MRVLRGLATSVLHLAMAAALVIIALATYGPVESATLQAGRHTQKLIVETKAAVPASSTLGASTQVNASDLPPHTSPTPPAQTPNLPTDREQPCTECPLNESPDAPATYRCADHCNAYRCPPCAPGTLGDKPNIACSTVACRALNNTDAAPAP
jgi:hypothetical protein